MTLKCISNKKNSKKSFHNNKTSGKMEFDSWESWLGVLEGGCEEQDRMALELCGKNEGADGIKLSKRWQSRIVQACVESSFLYVSQARLRYKRVVSKLSRCMCKCHRHVLNNKNGEPLRLMAERFVFSGAYPGI